MRILPIILLFALLASACSTAETANTTTIAAVSPTVSPSPSPKPTISKEESKKQAKEADDKKQQAINEFITKNHRGWQLKGISTENGECEEYSDEPCNLLLVRGEREKVVAVMMKRFAAPDGKSYLVVYEVRQIDLAQTKIEQIRESEKQITLENLEFDDVSDDLREEIYDAERERLENIASSYESRDQN